MTHLDPSADKQSTMGWLDGKMVFRSKNLAGLIRYGRKHGITLAELGEDIALYRGGLYRVTFGNGATCRGCFADPRIMLGFFVDRKFVNRIDCERVTFNRGTAGWAITVPFMLDIGREGPMRFGPWIASAYHTATGTPMVRFERSA